VAFAVIMVFVRHFLFALFGFLPLAASGAAMSDPQDAYAAQRRAMVGTIAAIAVESRSETGREHLSDSVMAAMAKVPRHRFVPAEIEAIAYANRPLPIGYGQTISQPFIVALMTDLAEIQPADKVLEVGTGSGYQAAVLAELAHKVYTIEIVEPLGREAAQRLQALGYRNVVTKIGDGYGGWPENAPFDAIIVTAAASKVPAPLIEQLKPGGRLAIPTGGRSGVQTLWLIRKNQDGTVTRRAVLAVRFVPLTDRSGRQQ